MINKRKAPMRKDVADLVGVSETVVSYVLNNNRSIAKEKRERVLRQWKPSMTGPIMWRWS